MMALLVFWLAAALLAYTWIGYPLLLRAFAALTAIEAAAMARPVVATAVDGTPEVVRDRRTGRLVPPADPPALAQALLDLLRDPEAARRMGQAGRDSALLRFDLDRQVAATAHVYRRAAR